MPAGIAWNPDPAVGVNLRMAPGNDLGATPGGNLDLVGNAEPASNVWQAAVLALTTTLGTYLWNVDGYGTRLRRFVDMPMTDDLQAQIEAEVRSTVLADPRVLDVLSLTVTQTSDPDGYSIDLVLSTSSGANVGGSVALVGN